MEKAKNNVNPRRSLLKKIMIFVGIGMLCVFVLVSGFTAWVTYTLEHTRSGEFIESLPLELVPTAEYLLNHPMPIPEYLSMNIPLASQTCVFLFNADPMGVSRFFINGSRLPADLMHNASFWPDERPSSSEETEFSKRKGQACIGVQLKKGLHLIGFQPDVLALYPIHEWAIEVK